ncbi:hypothetical protein KY306_02205 [Candidatus Woesearchaeota archaeon]|nr:hypothetical protein [Candidatus Woesearchaeota archaeon]
MKQYYKDMSRDAMVSMLEVWYYGETTGFKDWYGKEIPFKPEIIMDNNEGLTDAYYDPEGVEWVKNYPLELIKNNPDFIKSAVKRFLRLVEETLEPIWKADKALTKGELKQFFLDMKLAWTGLEISFRFPYCKNAKKEDLDAAKEARVKTERFFDLGNHIVKISLEKLYPELGDLIKYLTIEEATEGKLPSTETLKQRAKHYIIVENKLFDKSLEEIEKIYGISVERTEFDSDIKELRGTVASTGIVKGKVKLVRTLDKLKEVEKGDILVAPMTTPDYVPAMEKAAAFVTDEGGMTCHAAIVSREMGKPCLIGTKIATKIFKDGDLVEVDAEKGIVKKL